MSETHDDLSGWGYFAPENLEMALAKAREPSETLVELSKAFRRLFSSPDGALVFEHLESRTLRTPVMAPGVPDPVIAAAMREGENNLFRYIAAMTRMADRLSEPTRETSNVRHE